MHRRDFYYELPDDLIAQHPLPERTGSRLLCLEGSTGEFADRTFADLRELLRPGDLLVVNDTRVLCARLLGRKASGGRTEILVERLLDAERLLAKVRASKPPKPGAIIELNDGRCLEVLRRVGEFYELKATGGEHVAVLLDELGSTPLPPYIRRYPDDADRERYQTVYAKHPGAVAAPTAGLHFDRAMIERLERLGVAIGFVTLHVGAGTFQPLRADTIEEHRMHAERLEVSAALCEQVRHTKKQNGRVVAVGTTSVRALETAASRGTLAPYTGETKIFIYPGYRFKTIDAMITNFHLPESTLLMLVCAFAGREQVLRAYHHAIARRYRFFSYGDAMWVTPRAL
jgi:S-adenosylmethionine:tRNA ribosyltransferase-isomerase